MNSGIAAAKTPAGGCTGQPEVTAKANEPAGLVVDDADDPDREEPQQPRERRIQTPQKSRVVDLAAPDPVSTPLFQLNDEESGLSCGHDPGDPVRTHDARDNGSRGAGTTRTIPSEWNWIGNGSVGSNPVPLRLHVIVRRRQ